MKSSFSSPRGQIITVLDFVVSYLLRHWPSWAWLPANPEISRDARTNPIRGRKEVSHWGGVNINFYSLSEDTPALKTIEFMSLHSAVLWRPGGVEWSRISWVISYLYLRKALPTGQHQLVCSTGTGRLCHRDVNGEASSLLHPLLLSTQASPPPWVLPSTSLVIWNYLTCWPEQVPLLQNRDGTFHLYFYVWHFGDAQIVFSGPNLLYTQYILASIFSIFFYRFLLTWLGLLSDQFTHISQIVIRTGTWIHVVGELSSETLPWKANWGGK